MSQWESQEWDSHRSGDWSAAAAEAVVVDGSTWTFQQKEILLRDLNEYLQGEEWKTVFSMFVNSNCAVFDDPAQQQYSEGQTEIWSKFKDFSREQINGSVHHYSSQGATVFNEFLHLSHEVFSDEDLERQLYVTAQTKNLMLLVNYMEEFGKFMAQRNQEMDAEAMAADAGQDSAPSENTGRSKHDKKKHHHKSRKLRKLKTAKLLRRPSERFLDAVMAQPEDTESGHGRSGSNQNEKWRCLYCNSMNASDARSCILCGLAPATESSESLLKRCKKARRVVNDFISKQKFDNVKTVAKRWVARAAHIEVVAHMLYADHRHKDAVKLVEGHTAICKSYSNLRSAYLTSLNSCLTLFMAMCEWDKAQKTAETAFRFCKEQNFVIPIENPWEPNFSELTDQHSPASSFQTDDSHVLFVETPAPFTEVELQEMNLQYLVLLMNVCTLYSLYNHQEGGARADDYCARYAEHLNEPRLIAFLRRRLTVLIEVYLSRKQHNQAAPLSQQLSSAVMSSALLTEPLLMSACIQCAKSVVEVLLAQGADVEAVGTNGCTALFCAVRSKSYAEQLTKMLLDSHANPDTVDNDGCTSLHYAASTGNSALVALLMGYGADTNITDNYGSLPADYAAQVRDTESQLLLLNVENARQRLNSAASGEYESEAGSDEAKGSSTTSQRGSEWVECFDEESGYPFFVNTVTGESEWASKDVWEQHEREIKEQLATTAGNKATGNWVDDGHGVGDAQLDAGDRQAWNEVDNVRNSIQHLSEVTSNLHAQELQQQAETENIAAQYDQEIAGAKSEMDQVKAQLEGLKSEQEAQLSAAQGALEEQRAELKRQQSLQEVEKKQIAAALAEKQEKIEEMKNKEEMMKERLKALEEKFQTAQQKKQQAQQNAAKEGLKLEMKQHVAMKEKEKIISNFKNNLRALDEGLAKERSRHRLNLLKKLQLRREKNARRKNSGNSPRNGSNPKLPKDLKALRPAAPPPGLKPGGKPGPPPGSPPPGAANGAANGRPKLHKPMLRKPRIVSEAMDNDQVPAPRKAHSFSTSSPKGPPPTLHVKSNSSGELEPIGNASPTAKSRRKRRKKPPPPPPNSLPKL